MLQVRNRDLSAVLEALPEFPLEDSPAAAAATVDPDLPDDDVLYSLFQTLSKHQQHVQVGASMDTQCVAV